MHQHVAIKVREINFSGFALTKLGKLDEGIRCWA